MENSMEVVQKLKNRTIIQSRNPTSGNLSKDNENTNLKTYAPQNVHSRIIYNSRYIEAT